MTISALRGGLGLAVLGLILACGGGSTGTGNDNGNDNGNGNDPGAGLAVDAGPDRYAEPGAHVTLDGAGTRASGASVVSWAWAQTGGSGVTVTGADTARLGFDAPDAVGTTLEFRLTAQDSQGRTGQATVRVEIVEPGGVAETTSGGKIWKAYQAGTLDRDTAYQYLAFSLYEDPRLPAEYVGEPERSASWKLHLLAEGLDTLSPEARAVVEPFLLPPGDPRSHDAVQLAQRPRAFADAEPPSWQCEERAHVAVWYLSDLAGGQQLAARVANEAEATIWPRLQEVWGPAHLPILEMDAESPIVPISKEHKLNIYFKRGMRDYGGETPYHAPPAPSRIDLRESLAYSGKSPAGMIESLAHEMTHSCQDSYKQKETYDDAKWVFEGIATWAEDDVYPTTDSEQEYSGSLLHSMGQPLDRDAGSRAYGSYLFFQWVTHVVEDRAFVRRVFENFQTRPALQAVDEAFVAVADQRLADVWPRFLEAAWNHGQDGWFRRNDRLEDEAWDEVNGAGSQPAVMLGPDLELQLGARVPHLAARYRHFTLQEVQRFLAFHDGLTWPLDLVEDSEGNRTYDTDLAAGRQEGAAVRILVAKDGEWKQWYAGELYGMGTRSACREYAPTAFDEVVVIYGDGKPARGHVVKPVQRDPVLWTTNLSCFGWEGQATLTRSGDGGGPDFSISASMRWEYNGWLSPGVFALVHDDGSWTVSGTWDEGNYQCSTYATDTWNADHDVQWNPETLWSGIDTVSGPSYRVFVGSDPAPSMSYTVTCTDGTSSYTDQRSEYREPFTYEYWCNDSGGPDPLPTVDVGGDTATYHSSCGGLTYDWQFTAYPDPAL